MIDKIITRRSFNKAIALTTVAISTGLPKGSFAKVMRIDDALLHINPHGLVEIYSGFAKLGQHGSEDAISPVCEILGARDFILMTGKSPKHLPAILAQHQTALCFTSAATNIKAATILRSFLNAGARTGKFIEPGVAHSTRVLAGSLDPKGMTVAVKA